ncbi:MAG TPA: ATPase domain-containing protein [Candidatus Nanoarchaeia archaeon]|nr:ATPase domain-containing protein [Candidatus Nanoarchaeia archaeon]
MEELLRQLRELPEKFIVLTILPAESHKAANMHILKMLVHERGHHGAYVSVNHPYPSLLRQIQQAGVDDTKLFFIDCVSSRTGDEDNVVYLKSIESLTNLSISLEPLYKHQDISFILIDSLDAFTIYHDSTTVIKFCRAMIERIREHEMCGVMVGLHEDTDRWIIDELSLVCDTVIDMTASVTKRSTLG